MSIYVCSDIHGKYIEWRKAIAKTDLNLENGDKLIILGDLIDRGGQSLDCVSFALNLVNKYPKQVIYLMGNHEKMMLDFLNSKINPANDVDDFSLHGKTWIGNGGRITVYSFLNGLPEGRDNFERLRATHELMWFHHGGLINQLNSLPYYHIEDKFAFVHAGFESNKPLHEQNEYEMIWIREEFYQQFEAVKGDCLDNKVIVHGHTPLPYFPNYDGEGFYQGNHHICIDGGSAMARRILIMKIDDKQNLSYIEQEISQH